MKQRLRIGLIGAFEPSRPSHPATEAALTHSARRLGLELETTWLPSRELGKGDGPADLLAPFQGLFAPPGKTFQSLPGALAAIRFCRERSRPFMGT